MSRRRATPVEFGAINLTSSDPIKHSNKSAVGSLIIEPPCTNWVEDVDSTHSATVRRRPTSACAQQRLEPQPFREFVLVFQNDLNMRFNDGSPVPNLAEAEDPEDSGQKALNYRTEPLWTRLCYWPALPLTGGSHLSPAPTSLCGRPNVESTRQLDMTNSLHNSQIGGRAPVTPIFSARAGMPARFRILHPGGHARNDVFMLHGHIWQEMPYQTRPPLVPVTIPVERGSNVIARNKKSPWHGAQWGHGPSNHFDVVLDDPLGDYGSGGRFRVVGDYLFRTFQSFHFDGGMWGLFRVTR
jgi:hypothetical protein